MTIVVKPRTNTKTARDTAARSVLAGRQTRQDTRFKNLMGEAAFESLAPDVQNRFSKCLKGGESVVYKGIITEMTVSRTGWLVTQTARLIGAPLPLEHAACGTPVIVSVTEDAKTDGQFWTRSYGRARGFPQVISSSKRFAGPTGLEEHIGFGIAMGLVASAENGAMVFTSDHYCLNIAGLRVRLPGLITPGTVTVRHEDLGEGYFAFTLDLTHRLLGTLIRQRGIFCEAKR